jgi:hypothetical protein
MYPLSKLEKAFAFVLVAGVLLFFGLAALMSNQAYAQSPAARVTGEQIVSQCASQAYNNASFTSCINNRPYSAAKEDAFKIIGRCAPEQDHGGGTRAFVECLKQETQGTRYGSITGAPLPSVVPSQAAPYAVGPRSAATVNKKEEGIIRSLLPNVVMAAENVDTDKKIIFLTNKGCNLGMKQPFSNVFVGTAGKDTRPFKGCWTVDGNQIVLYDIVSQSFTRVPLRTFTVTPVGMDFGFDRDLEAALFHSQTDFSQ